MVIGTVGVPGGLALLLLALPFIDRSPERDPSLRKKSMAVAIAIVLLLTVLSIMAYVQHFVTHHP
jgi:quinol-cytochrome oxidoreductase complex cytochrome b subunit